MAAAIWGGDASTRGEGYWDPITLMGDDSTLSSAGCDKAIVTLFEDITLTPTAVDGYELDTLTVTDKNGDAITLASSGRSGQTYPCAPARPVRPFQIFR